MLQVSSIEKHFGERVLFSKASLTISPGERVALFGRNGSGKSTLLKIIAGEDTPDDGDISTPRGYKIGYLKQHLSFSRPTVLEEACSALVGDPVAEQYKAEIVLAGLGFSEPELELSPTALSGGFQIRINLAKLILSEPNMLLLDEPTNYLDIVSLRWLEGFLQSWPGEMIVISHDRYFCDQVSTHSALVYRSGFRKIEGNSQKLFERISADEELHERTRENREKEIKRMEAFITRFKAQASKATLVQSRVKALARMEKLDELSSDPTLDFSFVHLPFPGKFPLEVREMSFGFDSMERPLIEGLSFAVKKEDRIAVIGKNGRGKSTLLKLLAGELTPLSGEIVVSPNTVSSFFAQTNTNRLNLSNTIETEIYNTNQKLSRTAVRAICGCMMFEGDDALKKISVLSGGERSRVLLGKILATPTNVLLLDEPTNHLDVESVMALTEALEDFDGAVVIVTHSEEILRRVATRLIVFQGEVPFVFEGTYDEFLDSIGWEGEESAQPSRGKKKKAKAAPGGDGKGDSAKDNSTKRDKAQVMQERSRVVTPLRERVTALEKCVEQLESTIVTAQEALATASAKGDGGSIQRISQELAQSKREVEERISQWEAAQAELEALEKSYEERLAAFAI
jgi:ATP-binding cassette subfamily F protein 3